MKKTVTTILCGLLVLFLASCSKDTPSTAVEKALTSLQKEDYKGYVDQLYVSPTNDKEKVEKQKEELTALLKEKFAANPNGKIKSFEVLNEEIVNDSVAKVTVKINFEKNNKTEEETFTCRTDKSGKWRLQQTK